GANRSRMKNPTVTWRRLDLDGREAAAITEIPEGWRISGVVELRESVGASSLAYRIECNPQWETRSCDALGFARDRAVSLSIRREPTGVWSIDGVEVKGVAGCIDIDLAFSPVTNLLPIRRLMLRVGDSADVRAAWLR